MPSCWRSSSCTILGSLITAWYYFPQIDVFVEVLFIVGGGLSRRIHKGVEYMVFALKKHLVWW